MRPIQDVLAKFGIEASRATLAAVWLAYVVVVGVIAAAASRDQGQTVDPDAKRQLHGFVPSLDGQTPLARWDSIWYHAIATTRCSRR